MTDAEKFQSKLSALALADDLTCLTSSQPDLKIQGSKVGTYGEWMGLEVSAPKSHATGLLHNTAANGRLGRQGLATATWAVQELASLLQGDKAVMIQGSSHIPAT